LYFYLNSFVVWVGDNGISDAGVKDIACCLRQNTTLRALGLSKNHISDDGVKCILELLSEEKDSALQAINLKGNKKITEKGAQCIFEILKRKGEDYKGIKFELDAVHHHYIARKFRMEKLLPILELKEVKELIELEKKGKMEVVMRRLKKLKKTYKIEEPILFLVVFLNMMGLMHFLVKQGLPIDYFGSMEIGFTPFYIAKERGLKLMMALLGEAEDYIKKVAINEKNYQSFLEKKTTVDREKSTERANYLEERKDLKRKIRGITCRDILTRVKISINEKLKRESNPKNQLFIRGLVKEFNYPWNLVLSVMEQRPIKRKLLRLSKRVRIRRRTDMVAGSTKLTEIIEVIQKIRVAKKDKRFSCILPELREIESYYADFVLRYDKSGHEQRKRLVCKLPHIFTLEGKGPRMLKASVKANESFISLTYFSSS